MNRRGFFGSLAALVVAPLANTITAPADDFKWHEVGWHAENGSWHYYATPQTIEAPRPDDRIYFLSHDGPYVLNGRYASKL